MKKFHMGVFGMLFFSLMVSSHGNAQKMIKVIKTTHRDYMGQFRNKEQVITRFGIPTSKRADGEYEELLYVFGTKTVTEKNAKLAGGFGSSSSKRTSSSANSMSAGGLSSSDRSSSGFTTSSGGGAASANASTISQEVKIYVKFTLKNDQTVNWDSNGVDYTVYEMVKKEKPKKEKSKKEKPRKEKK